MGKLDNYKCEGQIDIFSFIPKQDDITTITLLRGSGMAGGKQRIFDFFQTEKDNKKRADFLKNEYGVGGWSMKNGFVNHSATGIDFEWSEQYRAEHRSYVSHIGWPMVAKGIEKLIEEGRYV